MPQARCLGSANPAGGIRAAASAPCCNACASVRLANASPVSVAPQRLHSVMPEAMHATPGSVSLRIKAARFKRAFKAPRF